MAVLQKYNHLLFFPFRKRSSLESELNLLRPRSAFFNLLNVVGAFAIWLLVVFVVGVAQNSLREASYGTYIGIAIALAFAGALFIVGATEIFYRLYEGTVKSCVERSLEEAKEEHARMPTVFNFEKTAAPPGLEEEIKTEEAGSERGREQESVADSLGEGLCRLPAPRGTLARLTLYIARIVHPSFCSHHHTT